MLEYDVEALSALGLTPALAGLVAVLPATTDTTLHLMRVTEVHRESVTVHDGHSERAARALPRVTRALAEAGTAMAVGDWVLVSRDAHAQQWVEQHLPPLSHIVRRDGYGRRHPVVSNVDTALLVMGLDDDFNPRRLERYLALVHGDAITPVVVLTKRDVAATTPDALDARLDQLRGRIPSAIDVLRDCRHAEEPGCAVREGVDADRLRNYHKLLREARRDTMSALDRQKQLAEWKIRGKAAKARKALKRGA